MAAEGGDCLQIWRVDAKVLNKHSGGLPFGGWSRGYKLLAAKNPDH